MRSCRKETPGGVSTRKLGGIALILLAAVAVTGCNKLKARDQLNRGVQSFKQARYQEAIERFERAVQLDPELINARLYLATAHASQFMPGVESPENMRNGEKAIQEFEKVLQVDPRNSNSVAGIANIYFGMKKMEDAKTWYKKQIALDPSNATAYYSVGAIIWTQTYQPRMEVKSLNRIAAEDPIKDAKIREPLCSKNNPLIEEGFTVLNKALELKPDYDDAMAYLNLMYRERADCQASMEARAEDLKKAEEWVQKAMDTRKKRAEAPGS